MTYVPTAGLDVTPAAVDDEVVVVAELQHQLDWMLLAAVAHIISDVCRAALGVAERCNTQANTHIHNC